MNSLLLYRGFNLEKLRDFNLDIVNSKGYSFFMETIYRLNEKGLEFMKYQLVLKIEQRENQKYQKLKF